LKIALPIPFHHQPPSKLAPYESRILRRGNPKNYTSAKVVLGRVDKFGMSGNGQFRTFPSRKREGLGVGASAASFQLSR
ncbi:hypothetical protein, partial [Sphingobium sp. SA916]|uniref:hypothetical protein n=1 Tax=Sphingobium sp. SA916 TaxID=1851207 RepID=UPI001C0ECC79